MKFGSHFRLRVGAGLLYIAIAGYKPAPPGISRSRLDLGASCQSQELVSDVTCLL